MIRFMSDTRYAGLEKEMQHIPGFRSKEERNGYQPPFWLSGKSEKPV